MIGADGEMLGMLTLADALRLALKQGLDLVEVNPKAEPPVCKLLDFDKYNYAAKLAASRAKRQAQKAGEDEPEE